MQRSTTMMPMSWVGYLRSAGAGGAEVGLLSSSPQLGSQGSGRHGLPLSFAPSMPTNLKLVAYLRSVTSTSPHCHALLIHALAGVVATSASASPTANGFILPPCAAGCGKPRPGVSASGQGAVDNAPALRVPSNRAASVACGVFYSGLCLCLVSRSKFYCRKASSIATRSRTAVPLMAAESP